MTDFLEALVSLAPAQSDDAIALVEPRGAAGPAAPGADGEGLPPRVAVGGPPGGGATEVAIELARAGSRNGRRTALIDADDVLPSVAQRLARTIEPNLRTAVDAVEYGMGELTASLVDAPDASFAVLCGLPNVAAWPQVRPGEVLDVLDAVGDARDAVIVNVSNRLEDVGVGVGRSRYGITRAVVGSATVLVAVGSGTPVGVTRLLGWIADARSLSDAPVHVVVNHAPADGFRRAEIADEIERTFPPTALWFVPHDDHVEAAAWAGSLVTAGPFARAVAAIAADVLPTRPSTRHTRTRRHRRRLLNRRASR